MGTVHLMQNQQAIVQPAPAPAGVTYVGGATKSTSLSTDPSPKDIILATSSGDLVVLICQTRNSYPTTPVGSGWTEALFHDNVGSGGPEVSGTSNEQLKVWWKISGGESTWQINITDSGTDAQAVMVAAFSNAAFGSVDCPFGPTNGICSSRTILDGGYHLCFHGTSYQASRFPTPPPGMTEVDTAKNTSEGVGLAAAYQEYVTGGATGTKTFGTEFTSYETSVSIAIDPA